MASDPYSIPSYLLDRANIQDTLTNMYRFVDQDRYDDLVSKIFASEMIVDYTSMFGGEPKTVTATTQAATWKGMLGQMRATQHVITGIIPELPQPGAEEAPTRVKVWANVMASLKTDDKFLQDGGRGLFEVVRTSGTGDNPWRIATMKADIIWYSGDQEMVSEIASSD